MSRPSADDPSKYEKTLRAYQLMTNTLAVGTGAKKIEDFVALLTWAIESEQPGFKQGDVIGIAAAAIGLGSSRSTVKQAVDRLRRQGLVSLEMPKSPYRIVSQTAVFHPDWLASATISATNQLSDHGGSSVIAKPLWIELHDGSAYAKLLKDALHETADQAIKESLLHPEGRKRWYTERLLVFRRIRVLGNQKSRCAWLHEVTFLALPPSIEQEVEERITELSKAGIRMMSLSTLLGSLAVKQLTSGRTHIGIGSLHATLRKHLLQLAKRYDIDTSALTGTARKPATLLRWEYGHFAARPAGLVAFSICHEDPAQIHLFARDLDFVNPTL